MRVIQIDRFGGAEEMHLADVPVGDPGPGEVRVRHRACGINFIDIYHRTGLYPNQLPLVLGCEGDRLRVLRARETPADIVAFWGVSRCS